jgi:site-specific DNA-methyltransferase (adenine-specific)/adenine-specific DNA-methyltransferase
VPTLDWIGKKAVLNHHREVPYRLLKCDPKLSVGDPGSGNLLVQGDNLVALKALLPYYAGQVKCIYIDPPYNTGDENWVYNDAVNSPEIRAWLGKVVGKEADDLSRHDKWLCMMYPRLMLLREFLRSDGVLFVSIDEGEVASLRLLLDEIFGYSNSLGTLVWKRRSSSAMRGMPLSIDHEYVLVYAYDFQKAILHGLRKEPESYPFIDKRGRYASTDLTVGMGRDKRPGQFYTIKNPRTGAEYPANPERVWRFFPETMQQVIQDDLVIWPDECEGNMTRPRFKTYYDPNSEKPKPVSSWVESPLTNEPSAKSDEDFDFHVLTSGMNQEGGRLLYQILGRKIFAYPKPLSLVRSLIRSATRDSDLVLDSYAGTGTTAHAVQDLNNEDGGTRRFLLIEVDRVIADEITTERLRRVHDGYSFKDQKNKTQHVKGIGTGFRFCRLGEALFDESGQLCRTLTFNELAQHVYFTETGEPLTKPTNGKRSPLIGVANGIAYYLLFNGILGDKRPDGGNVLTSAVLRDLPKHDGPRVVFGEGCRLGHDRLKRERITFRQIPYEIKVS